MLSSFSDRLLAWYDREGRRGLPWRIVRTPYRVWVSEIMLQQTQVRTVIPYFKSFVERFPTPASLAAARRDDVLRQWAGLGYYARARNLHLAARRVRERFGGELPRRYEDLAALPGIGRSTAGAILTLCFGQAFPILDGNVRRVLARHRDVAGWPGEAAVARRLWELSSALLPRRRAADYTQAIMDLGATVCTRGSPRCRDCPVARDCRARVGGFVAERPTARPKKRKPSRTVVMLIVTCDDEVLLQRRPEAGTWGGLLSLPEVGARDDVLPWCRRRLGREAEAVPWDRLAHEFTHFSLGIEPVAVHLDRPPRRVMENGGLDVGDGGLDVGDGGLEWFRIRDAAGAGVPAPVRKLLIRLAAARTPDPETRWHAPSNVKN